MDPEAIFDEYQTRESGLMTRRKLLQGAAAGIGFAAATVPARAKASVSALMCPPKAGSFGGGGGSAPDGGFVDSDEDYSTEVPDDGPGERRLVMINAHTGDRYDRAFVQNGEYNQEALQEFAQFARDWRQNEAKPIDPKAIEIVWKVWRMIGADAPFRLNSGYRSPTTNASLPGAAKQSYHMRGKAMDLSHPSVKPSSVHKAAMTLWAGGVGRYSTFTHVDSGPKRRWG
jgi:uncharacterized protein YcbK (DUF882 family)